MNDPTRRERAEQGGHRDEVDRIARQIAARGNPSGRLFEEDGRVATSPNRRAVEAREDPFTPQEEAEARRRKGIERGANNEIAASTYDRAIRGDTTERGRARSWMRASRERREGRYDPLARTMRDEDRDDFRAAQKQGLKPDLMDRAIRYGVPEDVAAATRVVRAERERITERDRAAREASEERQDFKAMKRTKPEGFRRDAVADALRGDPDGLASARGMRDLVTGEQRDRFEELAEEARARGDSDTANLFDNASRGTVSAVRQARRIMRGQVAASDEGADLLLAFPPPYEDPAPSKAPVAHVDLKWLVEGMLASLAAVMANEEGEWNEQAEANRRLDATGADRLLLAEWNEDDHPREENGRFTSGGGSSGAATSEARPRAEPKPVATPKAPPPPAPPQAPPAPEPDAANKWSLELAKSVVFRRPIDQFLPKGAAAKAAADEVRAALAARPPERQHEGNVDKLLEILDARADDADPAAKLVSLLHTKPNGWTWAPVKGTPETGLMCARPPGEKRGIKLLPDSDSTEEQIREAIGKLVDEQIDYVNAAPDRYFGGWVDVEDGKIKGVFVEVSERFEEDRLEEVKQIGRRQEQRAIYRLSDKVEIPTGGSGEGLDTL